MKKIMSVFLVVIFLAAVFAFPVLAQAELLPADVVAPPVFDWAKISGALTDLLTAFLIPAAAFAARWMFAKGNVEYNKLSEAQKDAFRNFLTIAVYATEQMNLKGAIGNKLSYVISIAGKWLEQRKLYLPLEEIELEIEAIVASEFNMGKILAPKADAPRISELE